MTATDSFTVGKTGCIGMCYLEPIVDIYEGKQLLHRLVRVQESDCEEIVKAVRSKDFSGISRLMISDEDASFLAKQTRIALRHCGILDPTSIEDYIANGGYRAIDKALSMSPEEVIEQIKISGLAGRGGAGFPTWFKWNAPASLRARTNSLSATPTRATLAAFMDRAVIESDPTA